jgi:GTP-binding protein
VAGAAWRVAFVRSCGAARDLPADATPEAALLGRSNVGKSSLLNALAGQPHLARTSQTPGRTRLLNLFDVRYGAAGHLRLVDCPGYGYARVGKHERERWSALIEAYLERRANLRLAVLLVDANVPPQALDREACAWLRGRGLPLRLVATKCDRLSGNRRVQALRRLAEALGEAPLPFSSVAPLGQAELRRAIESAAATAIPPTAGR